MSGELLLDTGAFVALVDRSEDRHADCVAVLEQWRGLVLTTAPVLTETHHLMGSRLETAEDLPRFLLAGRPYSRSLLTCRADARQR